jgi:hypoxanthine phosphoribosyltransferase
VIVDDVLNTGKHCKVAQALLMRRFPNAAIRSLFLARCHRPLRTFTSPIGSM